MSFSISNNFQEDSKYFPKYPETSQLLDVKTNASIKSNQKYPSTETRPHLFHPVSVEKVANFFVDSRVMSGGHFCVHNTHSVYIPFCNFWLLRLSRFHKCHEIIPRTEGEFMNAGEI